MTTSTTLQDVFDKDPLQLTDAEIDEIIAQQRAARAQWAQAEAAGKTRAPKVDPSTITLGSLNLKI